MTEPESKTTNDGGSAPDSNPGSAASQPLKPPRKPRKPRPAVNNLEDFLAAAYGAKGRAVAVTRAVASAIASGSEISTDGRARLAGWAGDDLMLAVAVQLLIAVRQLADRPRPRAVLREAVRSVLRQHPAVSAEPRLLDAVTGLDREADSESLLRVVANLDVGAALQGRLGTKLNPKLAAEAKGNLLWCMTLWLAETRGENPEVLVRVLHDVQWARAAEGVKGESRRWRALTRRIPPATLGIVGSAFTDLLRIQSTQLEALRRDGQLASERLKAAVDRAEGALAEVENQKASVAALSAELAQLRTGHQEELALARDDHEKLRSRVLRRLNSETRLLHEGLLALRRDPPKTGVMEDHAERVLSALEAEVRELEKGTTT